MNNPQNEPNIPLPTLSARQPRNMREMMQQRMLMARSTTTPSTIIQQPYQAPYQNLRERNDQKEKEIADFKRLHEEEKARTKQLDDDKKAAKREISVLEAKYASEQKKAKDMEKLANEKDKINEELKQLTLNSRKQASANEVLQAQQDYQTTHAKLQELKLREIELETINKTNTIYHDNKMKQAEIDKSRARIAALEELHNNEDFRNSLEHHKEYIQKQMELEYREEKEAQYLKLKRENAER
jgi:hypothetical protein